MDSTETSLNMARTDKASGPRADMIRTALNIRLLVLVQYMSRPGCLWRSKLPVVALGRFDIPFRKNTTPPMPESIKLRLLP